MAEGRVQIYTGDGKGKTTAALGLALRACGHGLKVFLAQFAKGRESGEHEALKRFQDLVEVRRYGRESFIGKKPEAEDIELCRAGFRQAREAAASGLYDLLILDEIGIALHYKMITLEEVLELVRGKPAALELVLTGSRIPRRLIELADLVTEMREVKHYHRRGVAARKGIEY